MNNQSNVCEACGSTKVHACLGNTVERSNVCEMCNGDKVVGTDEQGAPCPMCTGRKSEPIHKEANEILIDHIERSTESEPKGEGQSATTLESEPVSEFPQGKEAYCPQCYFVKDKVVLREDCDGEHDEEDEDD